MLSIKMISRHWPSESGLVYGLRDVTFDIERGELLTVMGASGSGKSTLLHILGLLDLPSEGGYEIEGREVTALPDRELARTRNRYFGFVFQRFHLLGELTALENVMLPMGYAGIAPVRRRERAGELLGRLGLTRLLLHYPCALSGGERQRVAIARALANDPGLLLADEPTGNLPPEAGREIIGIIRDLNAEGLTVVIATHDPEIAALGTRRARLLNGALSSIEGRANHE